MKTVYVSLVIPCYNEGKTFKKNVTRIIDTLNSCEKKWEIIFVEDKSTDGTRETLEEMVPKIKSSSAIYHKKNMGRGKSVCDGIKKTRGKICGFLDIDLEVDETYIPVFIEEIEKGADVAIGRRFYEQSLRSIPRVIASRFYSTLVGKILRIPFNDTEAGYKFFSRSKIIPVISKTKDKGWFWDTEICARSYWAGLNVSEVPVLFKRNHNKKSTVNLISDSWDYLKKLIKFRAETPGF